MSFRGERALLSALGLLCLAAKGPGCGAADDGAGPAYPPACYDREEVPTSEICSHLPGVCGAASGGGGSGTAPALSPPILVVPDAQNMPPGVVSQVSHNCLDIAWHDGRLFFAFRTAPSHFASAATVMYVVSTPDQEHWTFETSFSLGTDLREPRFLEVGDDLFLYLAELGNNPLAFQPEGTLVSRYVHGCAWTDPQPIQPAGEPDFILWRGRVMNGTSYAIGYGGGANIYNSTEAPIRVHWLTTDDGMTFRPAAGSDSKVLQGGTSETDWALLPSGDLVAVSRDEEGEASCFGSKICRAPASNLGAWTCVCDPKKYDSPLVFRHGDTVYLIGRRNVTATGDYDLMETGKSLSDQRLDYELDYWQKPKRCSLWTVDPDKLAVSFVMDLPSAGDTCFASALPVSDSEMLVYNYSSPFADGDWSWVTGQNNPTFIYRATLKLP